MCSLNGPLPSFLVGKKFFSYLAIVKKGIELYLVLYEAFVDVLVYVRNVYTTREPTLDRGAK